MNIVSYFKNKRRVHVYNEVENTEDVIFCPICFEDTRDNKTCNMCNSKWCMKCHKRILQSKLIFKDNRYNVNFYFYYCPISRRKIYLDNEEKKIMKGKKTINNITFIKERFSKFVKK